MSEQSAYAKGVENSMNRELVRIVQMPESGDERGLSFALPDAAQALAAGAKDFHIMTLRPSYVRGNHFHMEKVERLLVMHEDQWSFHWDSGPNTPVLHRAMRGAGAVLIEVEPLAAHAIRNDGQVDLWIIAWSEQEFDYDHPDLHRRVVV